MLALGPPGEVGADGAEGEGRTADLLKEVGEDLPDLGLDLELTRGFLVLLGHLLDVFPHGRAGGPLESLPRRIGEAGNGNSSKLGAFEGWS